MGEIVLIKCSMIINIFVANIAIQIDIDFNIW